MVTLGEGLEEFYRRHDGHLERVDDGSPPEVEDFFRAHDVAHVLFECDISLFGVPFLIRRARKMHKPWPWEGFQPYLDTPLSEIREEFNIMVRPKP